jgi:hypothetical protein
LAIDKVADHTQCTADRSPLWSRSGGVDAPHT